MAGVIEPDRRWPNWWTIQREMGPVSKRLMDNHLREDCLLHVEGELWKELGLWGKATIRGRSTHDFTRVPRGQYMRSRPGGLCKSHPPPPTKKQKKQKEKRGP